MRSLYINWLPRMLPFVDAAIIQVLSVIQADEDHRGGYFCAIDPRISQNFPTLVTAAGVFPAERAERRYGLSIEKDTRLLSYPEHVSSHQSANEKKEQYGGAILLDNGTVFSFSGLPRGIDDEAVCLLAAERVGQITVARVEAIVNASNNTVWKKINKI